MKYTPILTVQLGLLRVMGGFSMRDAFAFVGSIGGRCASSTPMAAGPRFLRRRLADRGALPSFTGP
jgi:hypothetical protein